MEAKFGADDKPRAFTRHEWVKRAKVNVLFLETSHGNLDACIFFQTNPCFIS